MKSVESTQCFLKFPMSLAAVSGMEPNAIISVRKDILTSHLSFFP